MGNIIQLMGCAQDADCQSRVAPHRASVKGGVAIKSQLLALCLLAPGREIDCCSMCWYLVRRLRGAADAQAAHLINTDLLIKLNRRISQVLMQHPHELRCITLKHDMRRQCL